MDSLKIYFNQCPQFTSLRNNSFENPEGKGEMPVTRNFPFPTLFPVPPEKSSFSIVNIDFVVCE